MTAVPCRCISRPRSAANSIGSNLLLDQIKRAEAERDALLAAQQAAAPGPAGRMLLEFKGIGAEFAASLWLEALFRHFNNRRQLASYAGLALTPGKADRSIASRAFPKPVLAIANHRDFELAWLRLRHQPDRRWLCGSRTGQPKRRPSEEDDDRRAGPETAGGAVERCHCRRRNHIEGAVMKDA